MNEILIPIGLLFFISLLGFAIVHTARQQRKAKSQVYREFAEGNGLRYRADDDGVAQEFARDFDGIGRFNSPTMGIVIPKDVVNGNVDGTDAILFRHSTRFSDECTREWFVAGVTCDEPIAGRCAVQFCKGWVHKNNLFLEDSVVKEQQAGPFHLVIRAASSADAGKLADAYELNRLAALAGQLSFRPEIQVRGNRIAVYLADRNAEVVDMETLQSLLDFAKNVTRKRREPGLVNV